MQSNKKNTTNNHPTDAQTNAVMTKEDKRRKLAESNARAKEWAERRKLRQEQERSHHLTAAHAAGVGAYSVSTLHGSSDDANPMGAPRSSATTQSPQRNVTPKLPSRTPRTSKRKQEGEVKAIAWESDPSTQVPTNSGGEQERPAKRIRISNVETDNSMNGSSVQENTTSERTSASSASTLMKIQSELVAAKKTKKQLLQESRRKAMLWAEEQRKQKAIHFTVPVTDTASNNFHPSVPVTTSVVQDVPRTGNYPSDHFDTRFQGFTFGSTAPTDTSRIHIPIVHESGQNLIRIPRPEDFHTVPTSTDGSATTTTSTATTTSHAMAPSNVLPTLAHPPPTSTQEPRPSTTSRIYHSWNSDAIAHESGQKSMRMPRPEDFHLVPTSTSTMYYTSTTTTQNHVMAPSNVVPPSVHPSQVSTQEAQPISSRMHSSWDTTTMPCTEILHNNSVPEKGTARSVHELFHPLRSSIRIFARLALYAIYICAFIVATMFFFKTALLFSQTGRSARDTFDTVSDHDVKGMQESTSGPIVTSQIQQTLFCFRDAGFPIQWDDEDDVTYPRIRNDDDENTKRSCVDPSSESCLQIVDTTDKTNEIRPSDNTAPEKKRCTSENLMPCPNRGRCKNGALLDCLWMESPIEVITETDIPLSVGLYIPSDDHSSCVLSSVANETFHKLVTSVKDLTLSETCNFIKKSAISRDDVMKDEIGESIFFSTHALASTLNIDENVLIRLMQEKGMADSSLVFMEKSSTHWVGLSTDYMRSELQLPTTCWIRLFMWDILSSSLYFAMEIMKMTTSMIWNIAQGFPFTTIGMVIILFIRRKIKSIQKYRKELKIKIIETRDLALDKLVLNCDRGEGYAALHLRDEIALEMYPLRGKDRDYFMTTIWPHVVTEIRSDNRVTKRRECVKDKDLEVWEWVADASRNTRKNKGSLTGNLTR